MLKKPITILISCALIIFNLSGCKGVTIKFGNDDTSSETSSSKTESTDTNSSATEDTSKTDDTNKNDDASSSSENSSSNNASDTPQVTVNITNDSTPDYGPLKPTIPQSIYYSNSFIFPNSSTSYLTKSQVASLSNYELGIARNEIYARHGYTFDLAQFKNYFNSQAWYNPIGKNVYLSSIEEHNVNLIKSEEDRRGVTW